MLDLSAFSSQSLSMPRRLQPISQPDLFSGETFASTSPSPQQSLPAITAKAARAIRIEDVGRVMTDWSDDEIERLRLMVTGEARRRGLLSAEPDPLPVQDVGDATPNRRTVRQRKPEVLIQGLAPGQVSAIQMAAQAGIKLSKIAHEFGLPVAAIKQVLAASTAS
jgi:hypothetical protein